MGGSPPSFSVAKRTLAGFPCQPRLYAKAGSSPRVSRMRPEYSPQRQAAVPVFRHSRFSYAFNYSSVLSPGFHAFALAIMPQETWQ